MATSGTHFASPQDALVEEKDVLVSPGNANEPDQTAKTHQSPLSPAESLKLLKVDVRQKVDLVANEPEVIDPVAMQFDDTGNIWIVEMSDYPNGPTDNETPRGRIRVLEDNDLDGHYESSRIYAEQLLFANGLQLYRDGVIVTAGDQLRFLRDTDGDGRSDTTEVWIKGFSEQNPQLRANDPTIAMDLNLYVANGLRSTTVQTVEGQDAKPTEFDLRGRDLRMDLVTRAFQTVTGPSQFGMTWDRFGNRYFCSNRNPCDAVLIEQADATLSPLTGLSPMTMPVVPAGEASAVHPLTQAWTTSNLHAGQFSAACGVLMTASNQLPPASLGNALTCEPTGSLVHRRAMRRVDGITSVDDPSPQREWLASFDSWFRPVNLSEGPDAAIYVVDMHRAVIEHPQFMPAELKERPDLRMGDDRGRIYRVHAESTTYSKELFASLKSSPIGKRPMPEWIVLLDHPNEWMRSTASRFLADVGLEFRSDGQASFRNIDSKAVAALLQYSNSASRIEGRLRAASILHHWGAVDPIMIDSWLNDRDSKMRIHAWRIMRSRPELSKRPELNKRDDQWIAQYALTMIEPTSGIEIEETIEAIWGSASLLLDRNTENSKSIGEDLAAACAKQIAAHPENAQLWIAATAATRHHSSALLRDLSTALVNVKIDDKKPSESCSPLPTVALTAIERIVPLAANNVEKYWIQTRDKVKATFELAMDDALSNKDCIPILLALMRGWLQSVDKATLKNDTKIWAGILELSKNSSIELATRTAAIQLLGSAPKEQATSLLKELASNAQEPTLFSAAIQAWSKHADPTFEVWLVERFSSASIRQRADIFSAFLSSAKRSEILIKSLEEKAISMRSLTASQIQSIKTLKVPELKARIDALIANSIDANRAKVIAAYLSCLEMMPEFEQGRKVFQLQCAACHKIGSMGVNVGPDISDSRTQTPAQLLTNILDPNRAIDNNFFRFSALTVDGQVIEGILVEETTSTITLKGQNNRFDVLQRSEIESFKSTGISMMPEGIESQVPLQSMADLIHFIKNWRYADANIPIAKPGTE